MILSEKGEDPFHVAGENAFSPAPRWKIQAANRRYIVVPKHYIQQVNSGFNGTN
jgi:hypothetical protein